MSELLYRTPMESHVDPQGILDFITAAEQRRLNTHAFILLRHGAVVSRGHWAPYKPEDPHTLFSLSKSFTSTAIGFAVQEGLLSLEDRLVSFFPDKLPFAPCENMQRMQLKHLITMSTGHSQEPRIGSGEDWVYEFLTSYVDLEPGTHFVYNSFATYMLSAVITKVTGQTVRDYLMPRLFIPLGIEEPYWECCPKGNNTGGWGLYLKTEDIARFALFLLQKGSFDGKQLIDPSWIEEASSKHIANESENPDWRCGYGYQFWRCQIPGVFRGDGAFGQYCVIMPEQDAAFVTNAGTDDLQGLLNLVWEHILPAFDRPETPGSYEKLQEKLASLELEASCGEAMSDFFGDFGEAVSEAFGTYEFGDNPAGFDRLTVRNDSWILTVDGHDYHLSTDSSWKDHTVEDMPAPNSFSDAIFREYASSMSYKEGVVTVRIHYTHMPAWSELAFVFHPGAVEVTVNRRATFAGGTWHFYGREIRE